MSKTTKIGKRGIDLIKLSESFRSRPYLCPAGVWTIGYGTTYYFDTKKKVTPNDPPITEAEAERLLRGHVDTVFAPMVDRLCRDDLSQNQFDAVVDFVYNCGSTYINSKGQRVLYKLFANINNRMPEPQLRNYWHGLCITAGGVRLKGLVTRRKREVELFFTP